MRVPGFRDSRLYFAGLFACLLGVALTTSFAHAQGFAGGITRGKTKKKVVLRRKLPSAIKLTATSFAVKTTAHDKNQADVAQALADVLEIGRLLGRVRDLQETCISEDAGAVHAAGKSQGLAVRIPPVAVNT